MMKCIAGLPEHQDPVENERGQHAAQVRQDNSWGEGHPVIEGDARAKIDCCCETARESEQHELAVEQTAAQR